ncbi:MAG: hypothetical protein NWS74_09220 [Salibacteraceae bacterium]|nr:hypothetical protein [Salibacteraceae bacterium]
MKLRLSIALCLALVFSLAQAQDEIADSLLNIALWGDEFELPRAENIKELRVLRNGNPLLVTADQDHIYLRGMEPESLFPGSSITLTSTEEKTIADYAIVGDSLHTLIKVGSKSKGYSHELVIYRIAGQNQGEVLRKDVGINISNLQKSVQPIFFGVSDNGNYTIACRQTKFLPHQLATFHVSLSNNVKGNEAQFELPTQIEGDDLKILAAAAADNGLAYIVALAGIKLNSPFRKKYLLYSFDPKANTLHEFDFAAQDIFNQELILDIDAEGVKAVALYHTDPLTENQSNGYTYIRFNAAGTDVIDKNINAFSAEMIKAHYEEKELLSANEISSLYLNKLVMCGDIPMVVFEKFYKDQICQTDPRTGIITCTDQFHYNGLTFENLNNRQNSVTINRQQIDYDFQGNYTSHQIVADSNRLLVFYNDHYKNVGLSADKVMNNASRSAMRLVVVNCNNTLETWKLTEDRQADFAFMPSIEMPRFQSNVYLLSSNGRAFKLGKIDLAKLPAP